MQVILFHGTTEDNAAAIWATQMAKDGILWCTNEPGLALSYGKCILAVEIPRDAKVRAFPLRTGVEGHMMDYFAEPAEFEVEFPSTLSCYPALSKECAPCSNQGP